MYADRMVRSTLLPDAIAGVRSPAPTTTIPMRYVAKEVAMIRGLALVLAAAVLSAAYTITKSVKPVTNEQISLLRIRDNQDIQMDEFQQELMSQIKARGIPVQVYSGALPDKCSHRLQYSASWSFAASMYLSYLSIQVYRGSDLVGSVLYDASNQAYFRFDKLGPTRSKLKALLDELFPEMASAETSK
jgi:hypothetical protein